MIQKLLNKEIYSDEFKKIREKIKTGVLSSNSYNVTETITAAWTIRNEDFIIKNIIKTLRNKQYETPIAVEKNVMIEKKHRLLYSFDWHELILQGALSRVLEQAYAPIFSNSLQSYRKGRGTHNTLMSLSKYLKSIPEDERVYILRKDIKSYGDTIPHDKLFSILEEAIHPNDYLFEVLKKVLTFKYYEFETKKLKTKEIGLPTGSPLNNTITNIFLCDLDRAIDKFSDECCYYRYGDDILVATTNKAIASKISDILDDSITKKQLKFNEEKSKKFNFDSVSGLNEKFKYLGLMVNLKGDISLTPEKDEELKHKIKNLIKKIYIMTKKVTNDKKSSTVVLNNVLKRLFLKTDLNSELLAYFPVVNDDTYWQQLDLWIAKELLSMVYNKSGDRAFKKMSFKELRQKGLLSLRHLRRLYLYDRVKFKEAIVL